MLSNKAFTGVAVVAAMPRTLHAVAAAAHRAFWACAGADAAAAAITPQRKRRTTAATGPSVDRGTI